MREYPVRICERLGVKFPGPTRQPLPINAVQFSVSTTPRKLPNLLHRRKHSGRLNREKAVMQDNDDRAVACDGGGDGTEPLYLGSALSAAKVSSGSGRTV